MQPRLVSNLLCSQSGHWTPDPPVFTFRVLGLQVHTACLVWTELGMGPQGFMHAKHAFYQLSHVPSSWLLLYPPFKSLFYRLPPKGSGHCKQGPQQQAAAVNTSRLCMPWPHGETTSSAGPSSVLWRHSVKLGQRRCCLRTQPRCSTTPDCIVENRAARTNLANIANELRGKS
jgi:hypothetical protein